MSDRGLGQWVAGALAVCATVIPPLVTVASPALTVREVALWNACGLLLLLVAFVAWETSGRTSIRRRLASWEHVIQQMRGTGLRVDRMQRHLSEIEEKAGEIPLLRQLLNEERHNLSLVASGMVEIRGIIDTERANLGALALGVHEVRSASEQRERDVERLSSDVDGFNEIVIALRAHLDGLSNLVALVDERGATEQRNLGLVAAGLDAVRRSAGGIDRFDARQAAFEDALVTIADRVDMLGAPPSGEKAA